MWFYSMNVFIIDTDVINVRIFLRVEIFFSIDAKKKKNQKNMTPQNLESFQASWGFFSIDAKTRNRKSDVTKFRILAFFFSIDYFFEGLLTAMSESFLHFDLELNGKYDKYGPRNCAHGYNVCTIHVA